ncbi:MAG: hypothetical protein J6N99_08915, partial [Schwartzia sp.]|nr:hypothetical protein [Schwartzia sp. (in: firmicutes)]
MTTAALRIKRGVPVSWSAAEVLKVMRTMQWFLPHLLFAVLLALVFTPGADDSTPKGAFLAVLAISEAALLLNRKSRPLNDVMTIL